MADIELVIKMPEELYKAYKGKPPMLGDAGMDIIAQAIANGTSLPEDHGDLIDRKVFQKWIETQDGDRLMSEYYLDALNTQDAIIGGSNDGDKC